MDDHRAATALIVHPHTRFGYTEQVLLLTVRALRERGWQVIAALPGRGDLAGRLTAEGARVETVDVPVLRKRDLGVRGVARFARESLSASRRIGATLRRVSPDVVVVSTMTQPGWTVAARLRRLPVLVHVQELDVTAPLLVREAIARPLSAADRVVVDSAATRQALLDVVPSLSATTVVRTSGIVGPETVIAPREHLTGGLRICCIARIEPGAGYGTVLDAFELLRAGGVSALLEIVTISTESASLSRLRARLEQQGISDLVALRDGRDHLWAALADADVAVVPSRAETSFGGTAVEVLLAGRPVIVTTSKGMAESTEGYASAIPVDDDAAEIAHALRRIVTSWSAFRRSATTLAPVAAQQFSPERYRFAIAADIGSLVTDRVRHRRQLVA